MASGSNQVPNYGAKDLGEYKGLGRGPTTSYFRRLAGAVGFAPDAGIFARLAAFTSSPANWPKWAGHVMRYMANRRHEFKTYDHGSGIYQLGEQAKLAIAGDWGTGTDEAQHVIYKMVGHNPDYTIHLGDVYYVGDKPELEENCLGKSHSENTGVKWAHGTKGSFALSGNHEMYACGTAYFDEFLPTLGPLDSAGQPTRQDASFFCLSNRYWRIIGLDTGYNSTGVFGALSFLSQIKGIQWFRKTTWFKPSCKLPDELVTWLAQATAPNPDGTLPGIILLSHHQYFSGFDDWYPTPAQQLRKFISQDRPALWFWGHEHRFAIYDSFGVKDGIQAFGRCIGHGGMPVDRKAAPDIKDCNCVLYDNRQYPNAENIEVGYNGFITLTLDGSRLGVNYYDLYDTLLLAETWSTNSKGELSGPRFSNVRPDLKQCDPAYIKAHSQ
jgi:Calcineurin-like phosphoesterase